LHGRATYAVRVQTRLLSSADQATLADERTVLADLRAALERHGADPEDLSTLAHAIEQLDEFFLLVVVGEFNAGKSAFLNVLLGHDLLEEGVTPTTSRITIVRHGEPSREPSLTEEGVAVVSAPVELLRELHVVDTPGTNAVLRHHEALTRRFVPRADLVLFVTSADRPFTESERAFLERIRDWGKKVVIVVNKADLLESEADRGKVMAFVREGARTLLGMDPTVFPVSAKLAHRGRRGDGEAWEASRFGVLEAYLVETLDAAERVRLKLASPLGVAERLAGALIGDVDGRLELLREDVEVLDRIERELAAYSTDLKRDFEFRMSDVEKLVVEMEQRGHDYFDRTLRLTRVTDLLNRDRMQREFERDVVGDTPQRIERKVGELIDWLVESDFRQWQAVHEHLLERRMAHRDRLPGLAAPGRFHHDRARLVESVGHEAQRVVETYDRSLEARDLADKARTAVAASAAMAVGSASLGAIVAAVASTAAADMTGFAMAGVLATLGLLVIPTRRRHAKQELRDKVSTLRSRLSTTLRGAFELELDRSLDRLRGLVEPYSRFVRTEQGRLTEARGELATLDARLSALRQRVGSSAGVMDAEHGV
jgi:small GTP-binding protein